MKVLVVGAGALGSVFGCLLKSKGHEVGILHPTPRLEDIRTRGITVSGLFGDCHTDGFDLYSSSEEVPAGVYDLVLVAVKSFHTAQAIEGLPERVGDNAVVVSLQNGLGNYEVLADAFGASRALAGRVIFGSQMETSTHAKVTVYADKVMIGSPDGSVDMAVIERIADAFSDAAIPSAATEDIQKFIWAKILYNSSLNPLSAILNVPYGKLLDNMETRSIMKNIVAEIFAVAKAQETPLFWDQPDDYIEVLFGKLIPDTAAHYASMCQDIQAGRRTEIDALNAAVVRIGAAHGVDCPVNATLSDLMRTIESLAAD